MNLRIYLHTAVLHIYLTIQAGMSFTVLSEDVRFSSTQYYTLITGTPIGREMN